MEALLMASLIWLGDVEAQVDSYCRFRKVFELRETAPVILQIAADSDYAVYLNGKRVPITQFPDFPDKKTYATCDVTSYLQKGSNTIAVLVHHIGQSFFTHFACTPGLMAALSQDNQLLAKTDDSWKVSLDPGFTQGKRKIVSPQLGFTFDYDSRKENNWTEPGFDDSAWANATTYARPVKQGHWASLEPRPIEFLKETAPWPVKLVWQGWQFQENGIPFNGPRFVQEIFEVPEYARASINRQKPMLSPDGAAWKFKQPPKPNLAAACTLDLGKESTGYITFDVEAAAGTVLTIHHGEHLDDGQPRSIIGPRSFIDRYVCHEGRNIYTYPLRRMGGRYLKLVFTEYGTTMPAVHYAGIVGVNYPLPAPSQFNTPDRLQARVRDLAINTLVCCMHDHYEDCPWREQSLYAYDSRNQILYGYYVWGNYQFAKASLELLGRSYLGNGYLEICAPAQSSITIPSFTMVWIPMLREHYLFSGSLEEYQRQQDTVAKILDSALERKSHIAGLYEPGAEKRIWNFFEWIGRLDRCPAFPDALYNIYLYEALNAAADLATADGKAGNAAKYRQAATALGKAIEENFWDEKAQCYGYLLPAENAGQEHYEHVQGLMLFNHLVPENKIPKLVAAISEKRLVPSTFSSLPYLVRGMMEQTPASRQYVERRLQNDFDTWALNGYTSLPETPTGPDDFYWAGSCCHGWSAIPVYYANCCNLGIRPLEPGFKRFEVKPYPGSLKEASGTVPTPQGDITVAWQLRDDGLHVKVSCPQGMTPVQAAYPEYPVAEFTWQR